MSQSPPPFDVEIRPDRARVILRIAGELDLSTVERVDAELTELRASGWSTIVLDLRRVTFMDSTGLRLLVATHQLSEQHEGFDFQIADGSPAVARVLELTGMSGLLRRAELRD